MDWSGGPAKGSMWGRCLLSLQIVKGLPVRSAGARKLRWSERGCERVLQEVGRDRAMSQINLNLALGSA